MDNLKRVIAGALLSIFLVACGAADRPIGVAARTTPPPTSGGAGVSTPPSTAGVPADVRLPSPENALLRGNRNDKGTALGRLCWIEREVALATGELLGASLAMEGGPAPDEDRAAKAIERVKTLVAALPAELGSAEGLPPKATPFRAHLLAAAQAAQPITADLPSRAPSTKRLESFDALTRVLNFEQFPGVKEFADAAKADRTACPDI